MDRQRFEELSARARSLLSEKLEVPDVHLHGVLASSNHDDRGTVFQFSSSGAGSNSEMNASIILDEQGTPVEGDVSFDVRSAELIRRGTPSHDTSATSSVNVDPSVNDFVLEMGQTFEETITVDLPADYLPPKLDVYFLADNTDSMGPILGALQSATGSIVNTPALAGSDVAFGVARYTDPYDGDFGHQKNSFEVLQTPTTVQSDVAKATKKWAALKVGGDASEGQFYALDQLAEPAGGLVGWRSGSKRIILWIGDYPGHDPVCSSVSQLSYDISEASVTAKLVSEQIAIIALDCLWLDADPLTSVLSDTWSSDYSGACATTGGSAGQASRLAAATGGSYLFGFNVTTVVGLLIDQMVSVAKTLSNIVLVPTGQEIPPFVATISPAAGHGPLDMSMAHQISFDVKFVGTEPCDGPPDQVLNGTLDIVADGVVIGQKPVTITVPACPPVAADPHGCACVVHNAERSELTAVEKGVPIDFGEGSQATAAANFSTFPQPSMWDGTYLTIPATGIYYTEISFVRNYVGTSDDVYLYLVRQNKNGVETVVGHAWAGESSSAPERQTGHYSIATRFEAADRLFLRGGSDGNRPAVASRVSWTTFQLCCDPNLPFPAPT